MSSEVSFDATTVELSWSDAVSEEANSSSSTLHEEIFSPPQYPLFQSNHEFRGAHTKPGSTDQKMSQVSASRSIIPSLKAGGCEGYIKFEWEWNSNGELTSRESVGANDGNGNYVEGTATQNSDGSGGVIIEGGHRN